MASGDLSNTDKLCEALVMRLALKSKENAEAGETQKRLVACGNAFEAKEQEVGQDIEDGASLPRPYL